MLWCFTVYILHSKGPPLSFLCNFTVTGTQFEWFAYESFKLCRSQADPGIIFGRACRLSVHTCTKFHTCMSYPSCKTHGTHFPHKMSLQTSLREGLGRLHRAAPKTGLKDLAWRHRLLRNIDVTIIMKRLNCYVAEKLCCNGVGMCPG